MSLDMNISVNDKRNVEEIIVDFRKAVIKKLEENKDRGTDKILRDVIKTCEIMNSTPVFKCNPITSNICSVHLGYAKYLYGNRHRLDEVLRFTTLEEMNATIKYKDSIDFERGKEYEKQNGRFN